MYEKFKVFPPGGSVVQGIERKAITVPCLFRETYLCECEMELGLCDGML